MLMKPFADAIEIIETIEQNGHSAYFVGGAVRDSLLNKPIGDIDITTSATPQQIQQIFPKVIPVGIEHGTVVVRNKRQSFEVTTFRVEDDYTDFRHPDNVQFVNKIEQDLERRDFTINALALDKLGNLIDPFYGRSDLNRRIVRTVGNPNERFREDPLRMMRALRFVSQLGFELEQETFTAIKKNIVWIEKIAVERIAIEFCKMFSGSFLNTALKLFKQGGADRHLPVFKGAPELLQRLPGQLSPLVTLSEVMGLFNLVDPRISIETWIKEWKLSNKTKKEAIMLVTAVKYCQKGNIDAWMIYQLPEFLEAGFVRLLNNLDNGSDVTNEYLSNLRNKLTIHTRKDLAVNGNDLMGFLPYKNKGPWISELLQMIEEQVVRGKLKNEKKAIKEWVLKWNPPAST